MHRLYIIYMRYNSSFDKRDKDYRGWLYYTDRLCASFEFCWKSQHYGLSFGFDDEHGWGFSIRFRPLAFYFHIKVPRWLRLKREREVSLSFHGGAMWWHIWCDPWGDERRWSKLRYGSFHFDDFFLGKSKCDSTTLEERDVLVPMPEKSYQATAKLIEYSWSRPRWFTKRMKRVEIDVPEGIPHEGKGTTAYNCGQDATFGMTTGECHSIAQGVGMLVGSCLSDRVKYGGYSDWKWEKPKEQIKVNENAMYGMKCMPDCAVPIINNATA